jgi:predicted short-subunit dehydrogenase-like oxidoreductase (DUF2520 family)
VNERIAIVGTGRVASALAAALVARSAIPCVIAGRNPDFAKTLANKTGVAHTAAIHQVPLFATHALVAVSDDAIEEVFTALAGCDVVLHTSGVRGHIPTPGIHGTGVLHPLQTILDSNTSLTGITFGYGGDPRAADWAASLIEMFEGKPLRIANEHWPHYHAAAVMASNYQAALLNSALELMLEAGVQENDALQALEPLTRASIENIFRLGPAAALTGPVQRGDAGTLNRHIAALNEVSRTTRRLYAAAGLKTLAVATKTNSPNSKMTQILEAALA